jgi:hypothetical protein
MAVIFVLSSPAVTRSPQNTPASSSHNASPARPDDCTLKFHGDGRRAVKLRTSSDGAKYSRVNAGRPMTVQQWYTMTCALDPKLPRRIPAAKPMPGIETQTVSLEGYLVAAKFDPDRDIHAEIGASPEWTRPLVVVEVPPGQNYCSARKTLWQLVQKELPPNSNARFHVMKSPPKVVVTGYVFLDSAPGKRTPYSCRSGSGRGIRPAGKNSQVQGLWEVHPVFDVSAE